MKSLAIFSAILFLGFSSFASGTDAHASLFDNMNKAEEKAADLAAPMTGEYFFGDEDAHMIISEGAFIVHSLQVKYQGQLQHFEVTSDDDKRKLRTLLDQGALAGALVTYLNQQVTIDDVDFKLIARVPNAKVKTLEWRAAKYESGFMGLPGVRAKYNRTVTFTTNAKSGALLRGEIYQVSLSSLFLPQVLPLIVP